MATSADRFEFTITSGPGSSWVGTKEPIGYPILKRTWSRPDELTAILEDIDKDDNDVDLDEVRRGDIISLTIDGNNAFYGEILNKVWESTKGHHLIKIFAMDYLHQGAEVQLDRAIYNGLFNYGELEVDDSFQNDLKQGISPLQIIQVLQPQGNILAEYYENNYLFENSISWDNGDASYPGRVVGITFIAQSRTLKKVWVSLLNPGNDVTLGNWNDNIVSASIDSIFCSVTMAVYDNDPAVLAEVPNFGQIVATKSVNVDDIEHWGATRIRMTLTDASSFSVGQTIVGITTGAKGYIQSKNGNDIDVSSLFQENILKPATGSLAFSTGETIDHVPTGTTTTYTTLTELTYQSGTIPGSGFTVDNGSGSAATGSSDVQVKEQNTAGSNVVSMGRARYVRLRYGGTGNSDVRIYDDFSTSSSRWISVVVQPEQTNCEFDVAVYVLHDSSNKLAARCIFGDDGILYLVHNDDSAEQLFPYVANNYYYLHFRIERKKLRFDFHTSTTQPGAPPAVGNSVKWKENVFFIDKNTFTKVPTALSRLEVYSNGSTSSGNMGVGWFSYSEVAHIGHGYDAQTGGRYAEFDFSDTFLDLNVGQKYAILLYTGNQSLSDDKIFVGMLGTSVTAPSNQDTFEFWKGNWNTSQIWSKVVQQTASTDEKYPAFFVEYEESWKDAVEGRDYIIDKENLKLEWLTSSSLAPIKNSLFVKSSESAPHTMKTVRISEYLNFNSNTDGIVVDEVHSGSYSAHKMTLWDIIEHLNNIMNVSKGWASDAIISEDRDTVDTDDIGDGFHSTGNIIDLEIVKQKSINEELRDLGNRYGGIFFISAGSDKTLIFHGVKPIGSITEPLGDNEYILNDGSDAFLTNDDYVRIIENKIGRVDEDIFTTFPVKGKSEDKQIVYINWSLKTSIGAEVIRKTEVFSKETNIENLFKYTQLLNELYGLEKFEGEIVVADYWPTITFTISGNDQTRLDTNGIVRVIDDRMETGDQVFKIISCEYNGGENKTRILVSNTNRNTQLIEQQLAQQKSLLMGNDPTDPEKHIHIHNSNSTVPRTVVTYTSIYARLYDGEGEIDTDKYTPALLSRQYLTVDSIDYYVYTGYFALGNGSIKNDRLPIEEIKLQPTQTGDSITLFLVAAAVPGDFVVGSTVTTDAAVTSGDVVFYDATEKILILNNVSGGTFDNADVITDGTNSATQTGGTFDDILAPGSSDFQYTNWNDPVKIYKWEHVSLQITFWVRKV